MSKKLLTIYALSLFFASLAAREHGRLRDFGIEPGILSPGNWNAITDVEGVLVGHRTLVKADSVRTGVTQVMELGNLETPIALTNTLSVFTVADALVDHMLSLHDNLSPLFLAVVEATEEAIYNSLFMASDMEGYKKRFVPALPITRTLEIMDHYHAR